MRNTFEIRWTAHAVTELEFTLKYLEVYFSEREIRKLLESLENKLALISENPNLFAYSEFKNIRRVTVEKYNTLYYKVIGSYVIVLSFFSNRQNPDKRHLISL